ncbi:hypothetical protein [Aquimarina longa]|uniref:hypothetical protein n=1 Tax=Aquimarina longa TaxID=1080221 RepID=UPI00078074C5|nr:hypothetical protein [Aquimarina longa]
MKKRKKNIKLDLKKVKISNLQSSQVIGGKLKQATFHLGDCLSSWDIDCIYSKGKDDMINRPR